MFVYEAFLALVLAVAFGLVLSSVLGVRGPWAAPWAIFLVLFLLIWAGGAWFTPVGPVVYDIHWLPFVLMGIVAVLLFAAATEPRPPASTRAAAETAAEEQAVAAVGFTVFFWVFVVVLAVAILAAYF